MNKEEKMVLITDTGEEIRLRILEAKIIGNDSYCITCPEEANITDGLIVLQAFDTNNPNISEYKLVTDKNVADELIEDYKKRLLNGIEKEV